jgi:hypothetical protein
MFSHFGNLGFLGGMQPHPMFGMQSQVMPVHYPGAFNPQPSWGANPQPIGGPMQFPIGVVPHPTSGMQVQPGAGFGMPQQPQMPVQGTMQRYPLMSGRINLGALGQSQMMRSPQAY